MARLAGCGLLTIPAHLKAEEPFDSLPLAVWQNARRNGLVMIHHPTPAHMSSRVQVASNDEPGEALIVSGQYSRRTVAHRSRDRRLRIQYRQPRLLRGKQGRISTASLWLDEDRRLRPVRTAYHRPGAPIQACRSLRTSSSRSREKIPSAAGG